MGRSQIRVVASLLRAAPILCVWLSSIGCTPAPPPTRPNIVFIMLDDVGYSDFDAYGDDFYLTPNIDRLASEGVRFTNYYTYPSCRPTRLSIVTGRYPLNFRGRGIPAGVPMLADVLREAGYATAHIGKWHLGRDLPEYLPTSKGFDHSVLHDMRYVNPELTIDDAQTVKTSGFLTDIMTDYALAWVRDNAEGPFFLNLSYFAAHTPWQVGLLPADWLARYPAGDLRGGYGALLSNADEQIGRLLSALDELGIEDRTLVIVASDNGGIPQVSRRGGFRGGKGMLLEGGIRSPLIARWPEAVASGSVNTSFFTSLDWFATLASLAGVDPSGLALDGDDLSGTFLEERHVDRTSKAFFWELGRGGSVFAVRRGRWKLLTSKNHQRFLYDLADDPWEKKDLSQEKADEVASLLAAYHAWRARAGAIQHEVEKVEGNVRVDGSAYELTDGVVWLENDPRFDIGQNDFSFRATVTPRTDGARRSIAAYEGSWRLSLRPDGRLELSMIGRDGAILSTLTGRTVVYSGASFDVAFTIQAPDAHHGSNAAVAHLYVDGDIDAEPLEIDPPADNPAGRMLLGNDAEGATPFAGTIDRARLYHIQLTAEELASGT